MIIASAPTHTKPQIATMSERHHEIKRRLVAGDRQVDIATSLGMTQSWLSIIIDSPVFKMEMEKERQLADANAADVSGRIVRLAPDAMSVLESAIREKKSDISLTQRTKFAIQALEMAGHVKPQASTPSTGAVTVQILQFSGQQAPGKNPADVAKIIEATSEKSA